MSDYTNLMCYEFVSRIEIAAPQSLRPYLSPEVDFVVAQDAPNLLYVYRRLLYKEGTADEAEMRRKERLYIERVIRKNHLEAKVISVEVMYEHTFSLLTKYVSKYNPVCFSAYFDRDEVENA